MNNRFSLKLTLLAIAEFNILWRTCIEDKLSDLNLDLRAYQFSFTKNFTKKKKKKLKSLENVAMTEAEGEVGYPKNRFKPPSILILTVPRWCFCYGSLLLLVLAVRIYTLVQLLC